MAINFTLSLSLFESRGFCMLDLFDQVKREKLGERITALQQLVSPYGKVNF